MMVTLCLDASGFYASWEEGLGIAPADLSCNHTYSLQHEKKLGSWPLYHSSNLLFPVASLCCHIDLPLCYTTVRYTSLLPFSCLSAFFTFLNDTSATNSQPFPRRRGSPAWTTGPRQPSLTPWLYTHSTPELYPTRTYPPTYVPFALDVLARLRASYARTPRKFYLGRHSVRAVRALPVVDIRSGGPGGVALHRGCLRGTTTCLFSNLINATRNRLCAHTKHYPCRHLTPLPRELRLRHLW